MEAPTEAGIACLKELEMVLQKGCWTDPQKDPQKENEKAMQMESAMVAPKAPPMVL